MKKELLTATALVLLSLLMIGSYVGVPWHPAAQPIANERVAAFLFENFAFTLILIALILAVSMIGGIFLAREEGP